MDNVENNQFRYEYPYQIKPNGCKSVRLYFLFVTQGFLDISGG